MNYSCILNRVSLYLFIISFYNSSIPPSLGSSEVSLNGIKLKFPSHWMAKTISLLICKLWHMSILEKQLCSVTLLSLHIPVMSLHDTCLAAVKYIGVRFYIFQGAKSHRCVNCVPRPDVIIGSHPSLREWKSFSDLWWTSEHQSIWILAFILK